MSGRYRPTRPPRGLFLTAALCLPAACAPDQWGVFEVDWDDRLAREARRAYGPGGRVPITMTEDATRLDPLPDLNADGPLDLSVEQATLLAMRNNRDLAVEQINPVIVGAFERIERGQFDPELFADLTYAEETGSETARATGEQFSVENRDTSAEAGIRQRLPTGTDIEAVLSQSRSISNRAPEQQEARVGLSVTQSLLRGFGPTVNLASVRIAELDTLASRYELCGFAEALLAETEIAYWNFVLAQREIAIFERSLEVARQQRDQVKQRIEVGVLAQTEAAAAHSEVALREQALIDARSALEARRLLLLRLINPDTGGSLERPVHATAEPAMNPAPITDTADRVALARRARPDLNEARLRLDQGRLETIMTRNGLLPRLDLFITLGKTGFADTFPDSFRDLDNDETYDLAAGASLSHFLGNRGAEGRDLAARATRQQAAASVSNLEQLVALDVRLAINEVERLRQQITATTATRRAQEQTVQAERERFEVGSSTSLLVAQAQRDLLVAELAEVEAVVNYRIALVELYLAEGSLLERRGVVVGQAP